jgi:hypothetical protein
MANWTEREDDNYLGELFLIGAYQTPFLNMIGGLDGARSKVTRSFSFPTSQPWSLSSASQPNISEDTSVAAGTATTVTRSQVLNTVQIFQETVEVSYAKQSTYGEIAGLASTETVGGQPVKDEMAFQRLAALKQIAIDADFTFMQGAYVASSTPSGDTAPRSRGMLTAVSANEVDASGADLTKAMVNELMKEMAENGAVFENMVLFCNAFQKQAISDIYGYAPESRTVGGVNVQQIYTDFAPLGVIYTPHIPTDDILIADMNYCYPVFCPVPGKGLLFYEDLAQNAASIRGQMYGQIGLDHGPETYHGKITDLSTS